LCVAQSGPSGDECGYRSEVCDGWIGPPGTAAYAGWDVGTFKPHHIEAYFTYQAQSDTETCNSGWVLEIRGLTEQSRSQMGLAGSWPSMDCMDGDTECSKSSGGTSEAPLGYRGRWWGVTECLGGDDYCVCNLACDQSGDTPVANDLVFHGCSCPPVADFDSTIGVYGSMVAFHPSSIFSSNGEQGVSGTMYTCVVNDAQGNNAPTVYCNNEEILQLGDDMCINKQIDYDVPPNDPCGTTILPDSCYGSPGIWWNACNYCDHCCNPESGGSIHGCDDSVCDPPFPDPPTGCCCGDQCFCDLPNEVIPTACPQGGCGGLPDDLLPCSHCTGNDPQLNHSSCNPCEGQQMSHQCASCNIKIRPNSNPTPWWVE
jgi:hypothetical protein